MADTRDFKSKQEDVKESFKELIEKIEKFSIMCEPKTEKLMKAAASQMKVMMLSTNFAAPIGFSEHDLFESMDIDEVLEVLHAMKASKEQRG